MGTVIKTAAAQIGRKIHKIILQLFLGDGVHHLHVKGGKTGGIRHIGAATQRIKLHMAGGMFAAAQFFTDFPGGNGSAGQQPVENAGLSHTGVPCEGTDLAVNGGAEFFHALAGFRAGTHYRKAGGGKGVIEFIPGVNIRFVDAENQLAIRIRRNDGDPIHQKGVCHRVGVGGHKDHGVNIGNCRANEPVTPRLHRINAPFAVLVQAAMDPVPHQRRSPIQPKAAPGLAFQQALIRADIVKAAECFGNHTVCHKRLSFPGRRRREAESWSAPQFR